MKTKYGPFARGRGLASSLLLASFLAASGVANATLVDTTTNNPLSFTWDYYTGTSHLTGSGSMTISGFNSSTLNVLVSLTNSALLGGNGGERLTAFGFGIDPNATSVTFSDAADAGMIGASLSAIPSLATIEICAYGGPNCAGGGNGGIYGNGGSDTFTLLLGGTWGSSVNVAPIGFKYQTGYGSFEFTSSSSSSGTTVPEPTTLSLLGAGLIGVAFLRRRKQQKAA